MADNARLFRLSLTQWMAAAMLLGILAGALFPAASYPHLAEAWRVMSALFLRLIKCVVVPIIFSTLVLGIAKHGDNLKGAGRLALRSLVYFECVTTVGLAIGLLVVNLIRPGVGVTLPALASHASEPVAAKFSVADMIEHIAPRSIVESAANNDVLAVVVFATLFAVSVTQVGGRSKEVMIGFCAALAEVMFKFTGLVMCLAPFGIAAAMADSVGHSGFRVLSGLAMLILTVYAAFFLFALAVLAPVCRLARIPVRPFLKSIKKPALIAFSTTSSEAALPSALEAMVAFGVPRRIVSFVLPVGYTFNLDGTVLYLTAAAVFIAQAAGISLTPGRQLMMMLTLMLTSKGAAGVPRAGVVILSATAVSFGLPLEGVAMILAVDPILDMGRSTMNVVGNCLASAVVARWEGEWEPPDQRSV